MPPTRKTRLTGEEIRVKQLAQVARGVDGRSALTSPVTKIAPRANIRTSKPHTLLYSQSGSLSVAVLEPRFYIPFSGTISRVRVNTSTATSSILTADLLKNGTSIFTTKPTVASGQRLGAWVTPTTKIFAADDYFEAEIEATGSASGIVFAIEMTERG